jgi:hypothetical protein
MTYLKVEWLHHSDNGPIKLLSELDAEQYETRKVEVFRNGASSYAGPEGEIGTTWLAEQPMPSVDELAADPNSASRP